MIKMSYLVATIMVGIGSLSACQSQPVSTQPSAPTIALMLAQGSSRGGSTTSGPGSWETPLEWKTNDSYVFYSNGKVETIKGHKVRHVIVPVTLISSNGTPVTLHLQLDTGADVTTINTNRVSVNLTGGRELNMGGVGGFQRLIGVKVPRVQVGNHVRENQEVAFGALPGDIDGLLGQDFLGHFCVTIDYQNSKLRIERLPKKD